MTFRIFRAKQNAQASAVLAETSLEVLSVHELVAWMHGRAKSSMPVETATAVYRRLTHLAFFEHGVGKRERDGLNVLRDALKTDLESTLITNPAGLEAFRKAVAHDESAIPHIGVSSLVWEIEEHGIPPEQIIAFALHPSRAHLLLDYFTVIGPEGVMRVRHFMVHELLAQRDGREFANSVIHASALLMVRDPAAVLLFTKHEEHALLAIRDNYAAARDVLVGLGLLPVQRSGSDSIFANPIRVGEAPPP